MSYNQYRRFFLYHTISLSWSKEFDCLLHFFWTMSKFQIHFFDTSVEWANIWMHVQEEDLEELFTYFATYPSLPQSRINDPKVWFVVILKLIESISMWWNSFLTFLSLCWKVATHPRQMQHSLFQRLSSLFDWK